MFRRRKRALSSASANGIQAAARRQRAKNLIASAKAPSEGGQRQRRGPRGRSYIIGRPRDRQYPQRGLAARQAYGLAPIPAVVDGTLFDEDED